MDMEYALWQLCRVLATEKTSRSHAQALEQILMRLTIAPQTGVLQRRLKEIKTLLSKMRHLTVHLLEKPQDPKALSHLLVHIMELRSLLIKELGLTLDKLEQRLKNMETPQDPLHYNSLMTAHNSLTFIGTLAAINKQFISLAALCDLFLAEALEDIADVKPLIPKMVSILGLLLGHKNNLPDLNNLPHQELTEELLGRLKQTYNLKILQKAFKRVF